MKKIYQLENIKPFNMKNLWESVYNERIKKHNNKKKAIISANSRVYSECLKVFLKGNNK